MLWLLWACSGQQEARDAELDGVQVEMQAHRAEADAAREAIIAGDLTAARAAGAALVARLPIPDLPAAEQAAVKTAAEALSSAGSVELAAHRFSEMSAACGGCHTARGVTPAMAAPSPPPVHEGFDAQMQRYHWAAERMWQGLVLPSDAAFDEARAELRKIPTDGFRPQLDGVLPVDAATMDAAVHGAAAEAGVGAAGAYGGMLLTCALCHLHSPASPAYDE